LIFLWYYYQVANLCAPVEEWTVGGTALTSLMDVERRHGILNYTILFCYDVVATLRSMIRLNNTDCLSNALLVRNIFFLCMSRQSIFILFMF
jgi:hypothetical protein